MTETTNSIDEIETRLARAERLGWLDDEKNKPTWDDVRFLLELAKELEDENITEEQVFYGVALRDLLFRRHVIEQLTAMGDEQHNGPLYHVTSYAESRAQRTRAAMAERVRELRDEWPANSTSFITAEEIILELEKP